LKEIHGANEEKENREKGEKSTHKDPSERSGPPLSIHKQAAATENKVPLGEA